MLKRYLFIPAIWMAILIFWTFPTYSQPLITNPDSIPFAPPVSYAVQDQPYTLFPADFDGDGDYDLAVCHILSDSIMILLNQGNGTFSNLTNYWGGGGTSVSIFSADFDGDGDYDIAITHQYANTISILKNNGDGTFATPENYAVGSFPNHIFSEDFDGDGHHDVAVANQLSKEMCILKNNGDGTFSAPYYYYIGMWVSRFFSVDLDKDGDNDLAIAIHYTNLVCIMYNDGSGNFSDPVYYEVGEGNSNPVSVYAADLDKDGDYDLAVANHGNSHDVCILLNNGDGTFVRHANYFVGHDPLWVSCGDMDGDGNIDLVVANRNEFGPDYNDNVSILKNYGDGTFGPPTYYSVIDGPACVFLVDFDADVDLDLAVANHYSADVCIFLNLNNSLPYSYSLLSPLNLDSIPTPVDFDWQDAIDPDPNDTVRYDLYISRSIVFNPDSTVVYDNLLDTTFTDSLSLKLWYWKVKAYDKWGAVRWSNETWSFYVFLRGDANADGVVDIADVVYVLNYLFINGPAPIPFEAGNVNCDGLVDIADVVYLINYLFIDGPPPSC